MGKRKPKEPTVEVLTLWQMLRRHGVGLYTAQMICNDVMLNGVKLPERTETSGKETAA